MNCGRRDPWRRYTHRMKAALVSSSDTIRTGTALITLYDFRQPICPQFNVEKLHALIRRFLHVVHPSFDLWWALLGAVALLSPKEDMIWLPAGVMENKWCQVDVRGIENGRRPYPYYPKTGKAQGACTPHIEKRSQHQIRMLDIKVK